MTFADLAASLKSVREHISNKSWANIGGAVNETYPQPFILKFILKEKRTLADQLSIPSEVLGGAGNT